MGGNRFWEFYLVRYLLGTIFGVVILFYLVINYNTQITKVFFFDKINQEWTSIKDEDTVKENLSSLLFDTTYDIKKNDANVILKSLNISDEKLFKIDKDEKTIVLRQTGFPILAAIILVVAGFLYMYFSSMIILVLHGIRSILFLNLENDKSKFKLMDIEKNKHILICSIVVVFGIMYAFFVSGDWRNALSIILIVLISLGMRVSYPSIYKFYCDLSSYRADVKRKSNKIEEVELSLIGYKKKTSYPDASNNICSNNQIEQEDRKEFIESYRHLREHGNAFGIIVCEIIFAAWLVLWEFSVWSIFYWCLIGFTSWILGSYLETSTIAKKE